MVLAAAKWDYLSRKRSRKANLAFLNLLLWLRDSLQGRGDSSFAVLKAAASQARARAFEQGETVADDELRFLLKYLPHTMKSRSGLRQLAFLGRALPKPPVDGLVVRKSLSGHKKIAQTVHLSPSEKMAFIPGEISKLFTGLFKGPLRGYLEQPTLTTSSSSCIGATRKQGGHRALNCHPLAKDVNLEEEHDMVMFTNNYKESHILDLVCQSHILAKQSAIDVDIIVVPELGNKVRLVSKTRLCHAQASGLVNKLLLDLIAQLPVCRDFLEGDRQAAIRRAFRYAEYESPYKQVSLFGPSVFVSTDLTAASDLLPHDMLQLIVESLIDVIGKELVPPEMCGRLTALFNTLRDIVKGIRMTYPDGKVILSSRGVLMGIGGTWPLMSIAHILFITIAAKTIGFDRDRALASAAIGGDDLIAYWPRSMYDSYKKTIEDFGGKFSAGKTFVSPHYGNFAEVSFVRKPAKVPLTFFEALATRNEKDVQYRAQLHFYSEIPVKSLADQDLDNLSWSVEMASTPESLIRVRRVLRALRPSIYGEVRKLGISATLPRCLGGLGLPPKKGSVQKFTASHRMRLALGKYLYGSADNDLFPHGPPSWADCVDKISLRARKHSIDSLEMEHMIGISTLRIKPLGGKPRVVRLNPSDHYVSRLVPEDECFEVRLDQWLAKEVGVNVEKLVLCNRYPNTSCSSKTVRPYLFAKGVSDWMKFQLKGGVPKQMAISNNGSRWALLARKMILNLSCYIEISMRADEYYGKLDHLSMSHLTHGF
jgi:hypothetical protein